MRTLGDLDTVIAVDLDGTLTLSDTLHESVMCMVRDNPVNILALPFWLLRGGAVLKSEVASRAALDVATLPYNTSLIIWLKEERAAGRTIVLCTAADKRVAQTIADHLGLFDEVIASDGVNNNDGATKRAALDSKYGVKGYDYAGNSASDIEVWVSARHAIVVNASEAISEQAAQVAAVSKVLPPQNVPFSQWCSVLRAHQWLANLLLFVPLLATHQINNIRLLATLALAFLAFSLCASAMYIANDLLDLESDRKHPRKRKRPFAVGTIPLKSGVILAPLFFIASLAPALMVGQTFTAWLVAYAFLTFTYSLWLKRLAILDCITLAVLYVLRILAGATAVAITLSSWLPTFFGLIFLSLAFAKRYAELTEQAQAGNAHALGRGYVVADRILLQTLGITAGYAAVLVLTLYFHSEAIVIIYAEPELLWFTVPLMLFWIGWMWMKANRGEMYDEPIVFALKDKASQVIALLCGVLFFLAARGFG